MSLMEKYVFRKCTVIVRHKYRGGTNMPRAALVTGQCHACDKEISVEVEPADLDRFREGGFAQDCFRYLSPAEREFLISGICSACWDEMFPPEDEDDGDYENREGYSGV